MPVDLIQTAIREAKGKIAAERIDTSDVKSQAGVLKAVIKDLAAEADIDLK
jgi:hypothetical protein